MGKELFMLLAMLFNSLVALGQLHVFDQVQIKDITKENESEWQASQVQVKIIGLSHQRFEIELYDGSTQTDPTLSYGVK